MAAGGGRIRMQIVSPGPAGPSAGPARPGMRRAGRPGRGRAAARGRSRPAGPGLAVAGVGCPDRQGDGISLAAATTGPAWTAAGGGWTGNGCDGSSVWTMDPNGNQASPSTLTWFFHPGARASACRLAVFVPTQNALGVASYAISAGAVSLGSVSIDQAARAGQWVTLGSYPVAGGPLDIKLLPGTATLTAAGPGSGGNGGSAGQGTGKGDAGGGQGDSAGHGQSASAPGHATPTPAARPATGHNAAVAASAASASCP